MYTYKDSIDNVKSAMILYPGTEFCVFSEKKKIPVKDIQEIKDISDLYVPIKDIQEIKDTSDLYGVGAIPLSPTEETKKLEEIIEKILVTVKKDIAGGIVE